MYLFYQSVHPQCLRLICDVTAAHYLMQHDTHESQSGLTLSPNERHVKSLTVYGQINVR